MKVIRTTNSNCRVHVQARQPFDGSHLFARTFTVNEGNSEVYVVYSWGTHFPIYVAECIDGKVCWYENIDKFSQSTSRHQSQARPYNAMCMPMRTGAMRSLARGGIAWLAANGSM